MDLRTYLSAYLADKLSVMARGAGLRKAHRLRLHRLSTWFPPDGLVFSSEKKLKNNKFLVKPTVCSNQFPLGNSPVNLNE